MKGKKELGEYLKALEEILGNKFDQAVMSFLPNIQKTLDDVVRDVKNVEGDLFFEEVD